MENHDKFYLPILVASLAKLLSKRGSYQSDSTDQKVS